MKKETPYILVADDDPDDLEIFTEAFTRQKEGAGVKTVNNGKELFEFLDARPPDDLPILILLDYNMPLIPGPEILQQLSSHPTYAFIPKLVWSSSARTKDIEECKRMGAGGYLKKPSTNQEVEELIRQIDKILTDQLTRPNPG